MDEKTTVRPQQDVDCEAGVQNDMDVEEDTLIGKLRVFLGKLYRGLKSLLGLTILLILYSILGMVIFRLIEYSHEEKQRSIIQESKADILNLMLNKTLDFDAIGQKVWMNDIKELMNRYEEIVRNTDYSSHAGHNTWGWMSSFFYCTTIYTTIGYGNIYPKTDLGRFVTILYALIGVPLALMVLAEVGKRFTIGLKFLWKFVRRYYYTGYCISVRQHGIAAVKRGHQAIKRASIKRKRKKRETNGNDIDGDKNFDIPKISYDEGTDDEEAGESVADDTNGSLCTLSVTSKDSKDLDNFEVDENFNLPISIASVVLLIYILLGAIMYSVWEQWSFMQSIYFVFISISTIGFGDVVPDKQSYFFISFIYLFIGLSLVSMCINVAIEYLNTTIDKAKVRMDKARDRMAEVGKEKMEQVGKHFDKAKDRAKNNFNEARHKALGKASEVRDIARGKAAEVRNDIIKEVSKIKKKKKNSLDSNDDSRSREVSVEPIRAKSEDTRTVGSESAIPSRLTAEPRSKSEDRMGSEISKTSQHTHL